MMPGPAPTLNASITASIESQGRLQRWAAIVAVHAAAVVLWELVVRLANIPAFVLPAPSAIVATLAKDNYA
jgi:NitT/TauT family transport system permease protein